MKLRKLSLLTFLGLGAFGGGAGAITLDEAIRNVDFSGMARYRYDTGSWNHAFSGSDISTGGAVSGKQSHELKAQLNINAQVADQFRVFGQAQYSPEYEGGYGTTTSGNRADTSRGFNLRQAYLEFFNNDYAFSASIGRQELGTIWTDDIVGVSGKVAAELVEGTTLAAFWVDGFEDDGDRAFANYDDTAEASATESRTNAVQIALNKKSTPADFLFRQNMYGAAAISSYELGIIGGLDTQFWLAFMPNRATFYAADVIYSLALNEDLKWSLKASYLGNAIDSALKKYFTNANNVLAIDNGALVSIKGTLEGYGFDGSLGALSYGTKEKFTINTLEDVGAAGIDAGKEIFYTKGAYLSASLGKNTFAYIEGGVNFVGDVRLSAQYVFGGTQVGNAAAYQWGGGKKQEIVAEISYPYTQKLIFSAWYSNLTWSSDAPVNASADPKGNKNTIQLEAVYNF